MKQLTKPEWDIWHTCRNYLELRINIINILNILMEMIHNTEYQMENSREKV